MNPFTLYACRIIDLPKIADSPGNLAFEEGGHDAPFDIKHVYCLSAPTFLEAFHFERAIKHH